MAMLNLDVQMVMMPFMDDRSLRTALRVCREWRSRALRLYSGAEDAAEIIYYLFPRSDEKVSF